MIDGFPDGQHGAILADPPWNFRTRSENGRDRCPDGKGHYQVMNFHDILDMPVAKAAAKDCMLFLWVTDPFLEKAFKVISAWGFAYATVGFTWVKQSKSGDGFPMGTGYYTRANPEMCLIGRKGSPKRKSRSVRQLIVEPRREHSRKPDCVRQRIQDLVDGPYLELFGRSSAPGWNVWGDQSGKFDEVA